ncbi:MAG: mannitol/fructose-specific phosphotransferase system IIA component (Ntr-type) [Candidatus Krumholzibacteriia bacterium]|jgi:mannitol/fructose-specific phosphotransferase system IIA component (Ntr-type)
MDIAEVLKHTSADLFLPDLQATDKPGVLAELVEGLIAGTKISNPDTIMKMLQSREALGSTAVAPGIAFPHGRTLAVQRLTILIGRSTAGVDYDSEDGKKTHLFFVLIAPPQDSGHQYIKSLAALIDCIQDSELRDNLMAAADYDTFCAAMKGE